MIIHRPLLLSMALLLIGCAPTSRTFNISVANETGGPVTLDLTKDGPPVEEAWASPEDIASGRIKVTEASRLGINSIAAGRTQSVRDLPGQFPSDTHAILRVYRGGDLTIKQMLSIAPGPDRQDVPLSPGDNRLVVKDQDGKLAVLGK